MAVTEVLRALGSWSIQVRSGIPQEIWNSLGYFGHVAVHAGVVDPRVGGDSLLDSARYVGVLRKKDNSSGSYFEIGGPGMAMWLGDEDGKGNVIETLLDLNNLSFADSLRAILPPASSAILEGNYFAVATPFTGTFQWVTQREAINYLSDTVGADWKVSGAGYLNAGPATSLFITNPVTAIVRRDSGVDMAMRAFPGEFGAEQDLADFTTRVVLLMDDGSGGTATADADILAGLNPYLDIHGNPVKITRLVSETATDPTNATARAQLQLNRFTGPKNGIKLSTDQYDIKGDVAVGDYIWVFDPENGIYDNVNEVQFRGVLMNPMKLRLVEMTWPVVRGMGVAYRDKVGKWFDLTDYVIWEDGASDLVVSDFNKNVSDGADGGGGLPQPLPQPNLTIPDLPTWSTPFLQGTYQSAINGETKAQTELHWAQPNNTDGTPITDGAYYEVRYRSATTPLFPVTHAQMAVYTHAQLAGNGGTWGQPIQYPVGNWQYTRVPFDQLHTIIYELTPSMPYEAQIRAVDNAPVANAGGWSALTSWQTAADTLPPAVPAAPEVAASLISVQVTHRLGKSTGGTFNLDRDLHHLEIHGEYEPGFQPSEATRLGRLLANSNMIIAQTPVVGTFPIPDVVPTYFKVVAVDEAGNKSGPSTAAVATAQLIDDAHISNLTASKITAGTITAAIVQAGWIRMGVGDPGSGGVGPAVELTPGGIQAFDANGVYFRLDGSLQLKLRGASDSFSVDDSNSITRLHVATSDVTIRDAAGNEVFSNESGQGWGITQPNLQSNFYQANTDAALQTKNPDSKYYIMLISGHIINHPKVRFGVVATNSSPGVGGWKVSWYSGYPGNGGDVPGGTQMAIGTVASGTSSVTTGLSYTWPSNMFGQLVFIAYMAQLRSGTAGVDWIGVNPAYFYGSGI